VFNQLALSKEDIDRIREFRANRKINKEVNKMEKTGSGAINDLLLHNLDIENATKQISMQFGYVKEDSQIRTPLANSINENDIILNKNI
jgi:hypothetical protein